MAKSSDTFRNAPPGISIPYYYQGQIWKIRILLTKNGQPPERGQEEYYTISGGSECLYQADDVRPGFPVVLVDEEFDAALIKQEASNLTTAVATGGMKTARAERWVNLLRSASLVLVSFPNDMEGNKATQWWLKNLPNAKIWPIPDFYGSVAAFSDTNNIREWIQRGIQEGHTN